LNTFVVLTFSCSVQIQESIDAKEKNEEFKVVHLKESKGVLIVLVELMVEVDDDDVATGFL
jgi:hypothetical protein